MNKDIILSKLINVKLFLLIVMLTLQAINLDSFFLRMSALSSFK